MNALTPRQPIRTTDADGTPVIRMPLAKGRGWAVLLAEDFDMLMSLGITPRWCLNNAAPGRSYVRCAHSEVRGSIVSVARLILEAPRGRCVRYADGDRTNLRRSNLYLAEDRKARSRELDLLAQRRADLAND